MIHSRKTQYKACMCRILRWWQKKFPQSIKLPCTAHLMLYFRACSWYCFLPTVFVAMPEVYFIRCIKAALWNRMNVKNPPRTQCGRALKGHAPTLLHPPWRTLKKSCVLFSCVWSLFDANNTITEIEGRLMDWEGPTVGKWIFNNSISCEEAKGKAEKRTLNTSATYKSSWRTTQVRDAYRHNERARPNAV